MNTTEVFLRTARAGLLALPLAFALPAMADEMVVDEALMADVEMTVEEMEEAAEEAQHVIEPLTRESAEEGYESIYRIAEKHQAKATLLVIKSKLFCRDIENPSDNCKDVMNDMLELLMELHEQLLAHSPNVISLREFYCSLPNSEIEDSEEDKRCRRTKRLQKNLELSPEEQLDKALKRDG